MKVFGTIGDDLQVLQSVQANEIQKYVAKRFYETFSPSRPQQPFDMTLQRRSDYYQVNVFLTEKDLLPAAEQLASEVENDLRRANLHALIYVKEMTA